jgi:hypothetical protein
MKKKRKPNRLDSSPERARRGRLQRQQGELARTWSTPRASGKRLADAQDDAQGVGHEVGK